MMNFVFGNNCVALLTSDITDTATNIVVDDASIFPIISGGATHQLTIQDANNPSRLEIVTVTGRTGNAFTVQRAREGTTGKNFAAGSYAALRLTAGVLATIQQEVNALGSLGVSKVDKAGDTMIGPLILAHAPTVAGEAVTKGYVDTLLASVPTADVNKAYVDAAIANLQAQILLRALTSDMTSALALKADRTYVDQQLATKALASDLLNYLQRSGGAMTGDLGIVGLDETFAALTNPVVNTHLATSFSFTAIAATVWTFEASGPCCGFSLKLTNGGAFAQTWPAGTQWAFGVVPGLTTSGVDRLVFITENGGTNWTGFIVGRSFA